MPGNEGNGPQQRERTIEDAIQRGLATGQPEGPEGGIQGGPEGEGGPMKVVVRSPDPPEGPIQRTIREVRERADALYEEWKQQGFGEELLKEHSELTSEMSRQLTTAEGASRFIRIEDQDKEGKPIVIFKKRPWPHTHLRPRGRGGWFGIGRLIRSPVEALLKSEDFARETFAQQLEQSHTVIDQQRRVLPKKQVEREAVEEATKQIAMQLGTDDSQNMVRAIANLFGEDFAIQNNVAHASAEVSARALDAAASEALRKFGCSPSGEYRGAIEVLDHALNTPELTPDQVLMLFVLSQRAGATEFPKGVFDVLGAAWEVQRGRIIESLRPTKDGMVNVGDLLIDEEIPLTIGSAKGDPSQIREVLRSALWLEEDWRRRWHDQVDPDSIGVIKEIAKGNWSFGGEQEIEAAAVGQALRWALSSAKDYRDRDAAFKFIGGLPRRSRVAMGILARTLGEGGTAEADIADQIITRLLTNPHSEVIGSLRKTASRYNENLQAASYPRGTVLQGPMMSTVLKIAELRESQGDLAPKDEPLYAPLVDKAPATGSLVGDVGPIVVASRGRDVSYGSMRNAVLDGISSDREIRAIREAFEGVEPKWVLGGLATEHRIGDERLYSHAIEIAEMLACRDDDIREDFKEEVRDFVTSLGTANTTMFLRQMLPAAERSLVSMNESRANTEWARYRNIMLAGALAQRTEELPNTCSNVLNNLVLRACAQAPEQAEALMTGFSLVTWKGSKHPDLILSQPAFVNAYRHAQMGLSGINVEDPNNERDNPNIRPYPEEMARYTLAVAPLTAEIYDHVGDSSLPEDIRGDLPDGMKQMIKLIKAAYSPEHGRGAVEFRVPVSLAWNLLNVSELAELDQALLPLEQAPGRINGGLQDSVRELEWARIYDPWGLQEVGARVCAAWLNDQLQYQAEVQGRLIDRQQVTWNWQETIEAQQQAEREVPDIGAEARAQQMKAMKDQLEEVGEQQAHVNARMELARPGILGKIKTALNGMRVTAYEENDSERGPGTCFFIRSGDVETRRYALENIKLLYGKTAPPVLSGHTAQLAEMIHQAENTHTSVRARSEAWQLVANTAYVFGNPGLR
jgi:hypothetical protein